MWHLTSDCMLVRAGPCEFINIFEKKILKIFKKYLFSSCTKEAHAKFIWLYYFNNKSFHLWFVLHSIVTKCTCYLINKLLLKHEYWGKYPNMEVKIKTVCLELKTNITLLFSLKSWDKKSRFQFFFANSDWIIGRHLQKM